MANYYNICPEICPKSSPWGEVQCHKMPCKGVFEVSTASHGGIMVHDKVAYQLLSPVARSHGFWECGYLCYEEDCDADIAIRELLDKGVWTEFRNHTPEVYEQYVNDSLKRWHPFFWQYRERHNQAIAFRSADEKYYHTYFSLNHEKWNDHDDNKRVMKEACTLFMMAGWVIEQNETSGACPTVWNDEESLYLHPNQFSGVVLESSIPAIEELLASASSFTCQSIKKYDQYYALTDEQYLDYLETQRDLIRADFMQALKTKRRNLYKTCTTDLIHPVSSRYRLRRLNNRDDSYADLEHTFCGTILRDMIEEGYIKTAKTKSGEGYRSATAEEIRKLQNNKQTALNTGGETRVV